MATTIKLIALFLVLVQSSAFSQEKLIKDIDFDSKNDTVYIDQKDYRIVCRLSTQNFKKLKSKQIETSGDNSYIKATRNGFEIRVNWMRSGYADQFRYERLEKRIRLIGFTEYSLGNAAGDGSGEASANLLTGDYIGNWHYYDHLANNENGELVKIPTIKTKLNFKKTYLEDFNEESYFGYSAQLEKIVERHKYLEKARRAKNNK
ncbi:hypothetical protein [Pedobacter sp. SL55]|uniref:hypothetical protein n=1 Tax=Pedobacter sp. SL55 TaxID=2995161 RepID=UPI002271EF1A|nr:hypothetical protein [Pedobacter sp. SL55]WAC42546.1 hypothetical protein OVA16_09390 [Pedobacter sp. SL55]